MSVSARSVDSQEGWTRVADDSTDGADKPALNEAIVCAAMTPELRASIQRIQSQIAADVTASMPTITMPADQLQNIRATLVSVETAHQAAVAPFFQELSGYNHIQETLAKLASSIVHELPRFSIPDLPSFKIPELPSFKIPDWPKFEIPTHFFDPLRGLDFSWLIDATPHNWDDLEDEDYDLDRIGEIVASGIPLAWVPRASVIHELLTVESHSARLLVLLDHAAAILDDCEAQIDVTRPELAEVVPLAQQAITAYRNGTRQAGGVLAVAVATRMIERAGWKGDSKQLAKKIRLSEETPLPLALETATRVPFTAFQANWRPGDPHPEALSRHVVAHDLDAEHLSDANSLVAIMLVSSFIRTAQAAWDRDQRKAEKAAAK